jgi:hypothetical protein
MPVGIHGPSRRNIGSFNGDLEEIYGNFRNLHHALLRKMENGEWRMENLNVSSFLGGAKGDVTTPFDEAVSLPRTIETVVRSATTARGETVAWMSIV